MPEARRRILLDAVLRRGHLERLGADEMFAIGLEGRDAVPVLNLLVPVSSSDEPYVYQSPIHYVFRLCDVIRIGMFRGFIRRTYAPAPWPHSYWSR